MAFEIDNQAPYGSLLKRARVEKRKKNEPGKRMRDEGHLAFIRRLPCIAGGSGPIDAAHLRMSSAEFNKPVCGAGLKPDDCWVLPLSHDLHMKQHASGEDPFFASIGIANPLKVAWDLYQVSPDLEAGRRIISEARKSK